MYNINLVRMKRLVYLLFTVAALFIAEKASAQQRSFFVNANTSEVHMSFGNGTSFNLYANGGWFLSDNFALVGGLGLYTYSQNSVSSNQIRLNAGARFYFTDNLFAQGMLNVSKWKDVDASTALRLGVGYSIFLSDRVALEPMANIVIPFESNRNSSFVIGGGISVYF